MGAERRRGDGALAELVRQEPPQTAGAVRPGYRSAPDADRGDGRFRRFARRYGWRAYALPVLSVVTVVVIVGLFAESRPAATASPEHRAQQPVAPPTAPQSIDLKEDVPGAGASQSALSSAALPPGGPYTARGAGTFRVLAGSSAAFGSGPLHTFSIDVENGITGIDLKQFQSAVMTTLADKRSWSGHGVSLQRVSGADAQFHITLTSSLTVRTLCGYDQPIETSCYVTAGNAGLQTDRVIINNARWVRGDMNYVGDIDQYRVYLVNHEGGHALGHQHAHACLSNGLAPAMMQQTIALRSMATGTMCQANPWPYPPGVSDAPGAEAPDTAANSEVVIKND